MATYNKRGYKAPKPEEAKVENELEEVVDTTDSTTAEVFNTLDETASKTEDWVAKNQKVILGVVGAIAIATLGYLLYNRFVVEPKEEKATNEIFQAQQYFQQAVDATEKNDSLYNLALKGGEGKLGFIGIAEQYAGTDAGNLANYHAGMAYLNLGDFKNAITYLEKFKSEDAILKPLALGAIGDALAETNKVDDAIAHYKKAAEASENDFTTPRFLLKAAQLYLAAGKKAEANKLFVEIKEKYETSKEGMNIDAFIAMTE
ncbi:tetratricopeptide repeat protein [Flavobacterium sp. UBA7663]|uniref:tetratricopeptide repeat protein n=1 Tax=Flavobacterium sp. UBA7663 TaxID=1946557 RepID=UPI0025C193EA|nr:tetratricopeptide repeat protein [Flavobacterium sp. UBA7663]